MMFSAKRMLRLQHKKKDSGNFISGIDLELTPGSIVQLVKTKQYIELRGKSHDDQGSM